MALTYVVLRPFEFGGSHVAAGDVVDLVGMDSRSVASLLRRGLVVAEPGGSAAAADTDSGAAHTIDLASGEVHDLTLTANCTLTFDGAATGVVSSFTLILRQDATGSRTVTWPASVDWPDATAPTLSAAANSVDVLTFMTVDDGTTWLGFVAGQALA